MAHHSYGQPGQAGGSERFFNPGIFDKGTNYNNDGLGKIVTLVLDMAGNPLVNARVVVRDQNGQDVGIGATDDNGQYRSPDLPIGFYDVIANQPGYVDRIQQFQVFDNNDPIREMRLATL